MPPIPRPSKKPVILSEQSESKDPFPFRRAGACSRRKPPETNIPFNATQPPSLQKNLSSRPSPARGGIYALPKPFSPQSVRRSLHALRLVGMTGWVSTGGTHPPSPTVGRGLLPPKASRNKHPIQQHPSPVPPPVILSKRSAPKDPFPHRRAGLAPAKALPFGVLQSAANLSISSLPVAMIPLL